MLDSPQMSMNAQWFPVVDTMSLMRKTSFLAGKPVKMDGGMLEIL
jgi:hypothetical protein